MYIACPECNTKFVVTPEQIGEYGRKVKCSKCSNIWHQKLDDQINLDSLLTLPITPTPLGNGVNLPALLPVKIQPYLYALPVLMIGMIIMMLVILFSGSAGVNAFFNSNNLAIKDVQINYQKDIEKISISYKVHNNSDKPVKMALIRIRLLDKNHRVIKGSVDDKYSRIVMSPNQFIQIQTEIVPAPPSTDNIDIMLGNKIDFILR